ncbi:hypothetical protein NP233_g10298 [Leucocoprinus birnbaumii]|uniref:Carboxylesterase type B domain-containing protein n=1 Tax=Leucocoprinus birnbaumii TaxID=56174 RepID=A0AAD5VIU5_9AGAR|nr:hypothetical protein NP233_g10298 [Leucocoprinus birnbaumii]
MQLFSALSYTNLLLALVAATTANWSSTVVDLGYAQYQGTMNNETGNIEFLGIRYAAAPTGSLRWREPQSPETTPGVQLANTPPSICMQAVSENFGESTISPFLRTKNATVHRRSTPEILPPSEDCLFLNIVTPAYGKAGLPVVIWIHGGGYAWGDAFHYTPEDLVAEAGGNIVAVVIQYRLGVFGFLAGQKVHDGGALNVGLLDQQFAFQWVQKHIGKFGGDPTKVTIWGQSCGAGSIIQHLIANDGNTQPRLFRGAMTVSTYLPPQYAYNSRIPEQAFTWTVEQTGCSSAPDELECLRQIDVELLNKANVNITNKGFYGLFTFVPVVDGSFITDRPTELLLRGKLNADAVFGVLDHFESARPNLVDPTSADTVKISEYIPNLFPELTETQVNEGVALYAPLGAPIDQAIAINGESIFICPTYFLLRALKNKAFKGDLAVPPAYHLDDMVYYFPNSLMGRNSSTPFNNTEFRNNFAQSFLNFAISLDPNVKWDPSNTLPHWPRWSEQGRAEMIFNRTETYEPVFQVVSTDENLLRRCDYWERIGPSSGQ